MRQAINNLQATATGFNKITRTGVFRVCDVPNVDVIKKSIEDCMTGNFSDVSILSSYC